MFRTALDLDEVVTFLHQLETYPEDVHVLAGRSIAGWAVETADDMGNQSVFDWDRNPEWMGFTDVDENLDVTASWGTTNDVWNWLDQGTGLYGERRSKYPIVAKNAPYLVFRTGYVAKTAPGRLRGSGSGGYYTGSLKRKRAVMHPGIKPRGWFDLIQGFIDTNWFAEYLVFLEEAMLAGLSGAAGRVDNTGGQYRGGLL